MNKKVTDWLSNKENIKLLLIIPLSILLIFVLKHRMSGGKDAEKSGASPEIHRSSPAATVHARDTSWKREAGGTRSMKNYALKAPPSLKRNIFAFRISKNNSIREEEQKDSGLKLNATITDDRAPLAIIGSEVLGIGDMVKGFKVTEIKNDEAVLLKDGIHYTLRMVEE